MQISDSFYKCYKVGIFIFNPQLGNEYGWRRMIELSEFVAIMGVTLRDEETVGQAGWKTIGRVVKLDRDTEIWWYKYFVDME